MPITIEGLKELRAELRSAEMASPRELTVALKEGADSVTARAKELVPKRSGKMASSLRSFSSATSAGVQSSHPGAGVQEFATTYYRQAAGRGGVQDRAAKRHIRKGEMSASEGGMQEVTLVNVSAPGPSGGRFAYKAIDDIGEALIDSTFDRITAILTAHGWFTG